MKEKNDTASSVQRKKKTAVSSTAAGAATSRIPKITKKAVASPTTGSTAASKSNKLLPDVSVQTGLPPQVEGTLRSYLILRVGKVTWFAPRQHIDGLTMVLVKWWGEDGKGSLFIPGKRYGMVAFEPANAQQHISS